MNARSKADVKSLVSHARVSSQAVGDGSDDAEVDARLLAAVDGGGIVFESAMEALEAARHALQSFGQDRARLFESLRGLEKLSSSIPDAAPCPGDAILDRRCRGLETLLRLTAANLALAARTSRLPYPVLSIPNTRRNIRWQL
jgi:hypothetical protein